MPKQSAKRPFYYTDKTLEIVVVLIVVGAVVAGALEMLNIYESLKDSKRLPCDQLLPAKEVERIVAEHGAILLSIERLSPAGSIWFDIDSYTCPGKADIIIYYGSWDQRNKIRYLLGDTFFGVYYRMINV